MYSLVTFYFLLCVAKKINKFRIKKKTHKSCKGCPHVKPLDGFYKQKGCKLGRQARCKVCKMDYFKKRRATPEGKEYIKKYIATPSGKAAQKKADDKRKADPVRYAAKKKHNREYMAKKRATPEGLVESRCDSRITDAKRVLGFTWGPIDKDLPRNAPGPDSTFNLLGIVSWKKYVKYLKDRFYGGMTWPGFEIDHIKPLCSFNLSDPEERKRAFHYTNTRPLFDEDNKGRSDATWKEEEHPLHWHGGKWIVKANWELIDENDKYGLNKYQRKVEPAAKRRKLGQPSIVSFLSVQCR